jgi:hypothetical protein
MDEIISRTESLNPMKRLTILQTIGFAAAGLACMGCVAVHKVTTQDANRVHVEFESAEAMELFYQGLLVRRFPTDGKPSGIVVGQTIYTRSTRPSANVVFNEAATVADLDRNGVITVDESITFAAAKPN